MPVAPINGTSLYYEVEGEGEWVIFVHGGGSTHLAWWRQVYFLRDKYKCLAYDARGLGRGHARRRRGTCTCRAENTPAATRRDGCYRRHGQR